MKKFIIRKTWVVKALTIQDALAISKHTLCDSETIKILSDDIVKGGNEKDVKEKIKITKKKKGNFKQWK